MSTVYTLLYLFVTSLHVCLDDFMEANGKHFYGDVFIEFWLKQFTKVH